MAKQRIIVLFGRKQYEGLASGSRRFSEAWREFTRHVDLKDLQLNPDEIFLGVRDTSPQRETPR